jgi:hypothetical protein
MFIIDLDNRIPFNYSRNIYVDYNAVYYYNLLKKDYEYEIETEKFITNFINVIENNKDLFYITFFYILIFFIILLIPLFRKLNNIYIMLSFAKIILLSRSIF